MAIFGGTKVACDVGRLEVRVELSMIEILATLRIFVCRSGYL